MDNKAIWITGAGSGLGKSLANYFIMQGKIVIASSRNEDALQRLKKEIPNLNSNLILEPVDISDAGQVEKSYANISSRFQIEGLINNAGITSFKPALKDSLKDLRDIINTNLLGSIYITKSVIPGMIDAKKGTIINIISVAAKKIFTKSSVYAASKAGLLAYMNVLREEQRENNIRIINILPGATKTPIWPGEVLEKFADRMMSPNDIAKFIFDIYTLDANMTPEEIIIRPIKGDL